MKLVTRKLKSLKLAFDSNRLLMDSAGNEPL